MGRDFANLVILLAGWGGGARLHAKVAHFASNLASVHAWGEGRILKSCNLASLAPLAAV